jgi:membrane-associated phospholipid phosphatase
MYCRFHYVVDVIAGLSLAFVALPVGDRLYGWMRGGVPIPEQART